MGLNVLHAEIAGEGSVVCVIQVVSLGYSINWCKNLRLLVLWLILPLFIFTHRSWKWGKHRFVSLRQTHELPAWNQEKQLYALMKIELCRSSHEWWCQQWLSRRGDLIWKWAPTVCHALCQMFKLSDIFLYAMALICLCKKKIPLVLLCPAAEKLVKQETHFSYRRDWMCRNLCNRHLFEVFIVQLKLFVPNKSKEAWSVLEKK